MTDDERTLVLLGDALVTFRAADEHRSAVALTDRARAERLPALAWIADQRRLALRRGLAAVAAAGPQNPPDYDAIGTRGMAVAAALDALVSTTPGLRTDDREKRRTFVRDLRAGYAILPALMAGGSAAADTPPPAYPPTSGERPAWAAAPAFAGTAGLLPLGGWLPFQHAASEVLGLPLAPGGTVHESLVRGARRFRRADAAPDGAHAAFTSERRTDFDRADALCFVFGRAGSTTSHILLAGARAALGHVLRDAGVLVHALEGLPAHAEVARRDLVVALGLVGCVPEADVAVRDPRDVHDVEAYLLATVLADHVGALGLTRRLAGRVRGAAAVHAIQEALMRLEAGELLSVV